MTAPLRPTAIDRLVTYFSPEAGLRRMQARAALGSVGQFGVSRLAGKRKGTLENWLVQRQNAYTESLERQTISDRAADLVGSDPHAASVVDSMSTNIVGTGLTPQSDPNADVLGWTPEQTNKFQRKAEWEFSLWAADADARERLPFWGIQFVAVYSMLVNGEFCRLPVMMDRPGRTHSLAIQCLHPQRLYTPTDMLGNPDIRDGVEMGPAGEPVAYWIADPPRSPFPMPVGYLPSSYFTRVPARVGHRPGFFHGYVQKEDEQGRGVSVLAPAMKFFRDLNDYMDYEIVGAIVAASFPIFIQTGDPYGMTGVQTGTDGEDITGLSPGQVLYGRTGEVPHVLKNERPGNTFPAFVERVLRAVGAAVGMPYEIISKDFSKTNYSSARAALLEAWRVFQFYQKWLVDGFNQKIWEMVLEESFLRGRLPIPAGSPDWYDEPAAFSRAIWIPPRRGHVDPLKEIQAHVLALDNNISTLAEIVAEGGADWESRLIQRAREIDMEKEKGIKKENPK